MRKGMTSKITSKSNRSPRIVIRLTWNSPYAQQIPLGVAVYAQAHTNWEVILYPPSADFVSRASFLDANVDGIITMPTDVEREPGNFTQLPTVMTGYRGDDRFRAVVPDHRSNGRLVAEHLLGKGLAHFGSFMNQDSRQITNSWMFEGFETALQEAGCTVDRFTHGTRTATQWQFWDQILDLADWLKGLNKPCGVFCSDDEHALRLMEAARVSGIHVPEAVAVVGAYDDPLQCEFSRPRLTSLNHNGTAVGYEAARVLDVALKSGQSIKPGISFAEPGHVVARESTRMFAQADPVVRDAMDFIWGDSIEEFRVDEVLRRLHVSRSVLFRRFHAAGRQGVGRELREARLARALALVRTTSQPLADIAAACGFDHISQLSREIKQRTGASPRAIRHSLLGRMRPGTD